MTSLLTNETLMKTSAAKYITTDLETCVLLVTSGFTDFDMYEVDSKHFEFHFDRAEGLDRILEAYHRQQLNLPVHTIFANLKFLKTRINERKCQSSF